MEVKTRRRFTPEFKSDVVNLIKTGDKSGGEIAQDLEISASVLYRWYKRYTGESHRVPEQFGETDKELRELRKQLADVMEERDILKKAISIFSRQGKSS